MGTAGLSCIACHDFNGQKSSAGALELVGLTGRLQKNWFHLYMRQPSRFHPTVIMPSYWPGGQSVRPEILAGNTDQQIEALWNYLSDGDRAKSPVGLSRQSPELRVADQTVMCRGRGTAGYRGIGVGYPERISLAFDTEEMAVRLLWKGEFASVNHGSFRARGGDRIAFPAGIPFHRLGSLDDALALQRQNRLPLPPRPRLPVPRLHPRQTKTPHLQLPLRRNRCHRLLRRPPRQRRQRLLPPHPDIHHPRSPSPLLLPRRLRQRDQTRRPRLADRSPHPEDP